MYRKGRPVVNDFDPGEWFYYRVQRDWIQPDGTVSAFHIQPCPQTSTNRQRYSQCWHVLYPREKFAQWAVFKLQAELLPSTVQADAIGATVYSVRTEHDPMDDNYGHCETRVYRGESQFVGEMNRAAKNQLRLAIAQLLQSEWPAGKIFPPE
jgi:hypothetical protein